MQDCVAREMRVGNLVGGYDPASERENPMKGLGEQHTVEDKVELEADRDP
jgi:hypothetical protein